MAVISQPPSEGRRQLASTRKRIQSGAHQDRVVKVAGRVGDGGLDVFRLQIVKVGQDFLLSGPVGQHIEHILHADAHPADARPPAALARLDCDAFQKLHACRILSRAQRNQPAKRNRRNAVRLDCWMVTFDVQRSKEHEPPPPMRQVLSLYVLTEIS